MQKQWRDRFSPAVKYWIFLVGIIAVTFAVIFGSFISSYLNLTEPEQAMVKSLFDKLIPFPFIGSIILIAFICTMVSLLFRYYIIPVLRMAEQTRLITSANPDFRITPEGAREMIKLAEVINESAEAYRHLKSDVDTRIRESSLALRNERNRLAALMSQLPYGVVVCDRDGRILLYSHKAQTMLQEAGTEPGAAGTIGLGRSIYNILEKPPLEHALEIMDHACQQGQAKPNMGLMTKLCGSRFIRVNMAPVTREQSSATTITDFVLSLEDITGEIDADNDRDQKLQKMVDAMQNSLGKLHRGINRICSLPGTGSQECQEHREAIADVSRDLENQLALARELYSQHRRAYGNRENVMTETLVKLIANNLNRRFAIETELQPGGSAWLKIDSYALVQAFSTLAGLLKAEYGIDTIRLQTTETREDCISLTLYWTAGLVPVQTISDWLASPLFVGDDGNTDSPQDIITIHHGTFEILNIDHDYSSAISVTLPTVLDGDHAQSREVIAPRPISFEFDLFHQPGQERLGDELLRDLTYVCFDTETTGLNPSEGDRIIQLGAVRIVKGRLLTNERIDQLVNPQRKVPASSVAIHGIDPESLLSQPTIDQVLPAFHAFTANAVLVAHNAAFDMRFLQLLEQPTGLRFDHPVLDTLLLSSIVHPNLEGHSLDAIAERFNITVIGRHTAIGDALVTAEILLHLMPLLEAQGIRTLDQALVASSRSRFAKINY